MAYGMQILQSNGKLWISPDFTPLNFVGTLNYPSGSGTLTTGYTSSTPLMIFAKANSQVATSITQELSGSNWIIKYASSGSGKIYLFAGAVKRNNQYGIAMYNAEGKEVWNTSMIPLQVAVFNNPSPGTSRPSFSISTEYPTAVCPCVVSTYIANMGGEHYIAGLMRCIGFGNTIYVARAESEVVNSNFRLPSVFKNQLYAINTTIYD